METHCEHHDHPRIPSKYHSELRRLYPEFYDHLKRHDDYWEPMWDYIRNRGKGAKYAHC